MLRMQNVCSPETKILMYDGTYRKVGDIKVGEQVMELTLPQEMFLDILGEIKICIIFDIHWK